MQEAGEEGWVEEGVGEARFLPVVLQKSIRSWSCSPLLLEDFLASAPLFIIVSLVPIDLGAARTEVVFEFCAALLCSDLFV